MAILAESSLCRDSAALVPGARDVIGASGDEPAFEGTGLAELAGIQAVAFGGAGAGRVSVVSSDGKTIVRCNTDGDAAFEFEIVIEDGAVLASAHRGGGSIL